MANFWGEEDNGMNRWEGGGGYRPPPVTMAPPMDPSSAAPQALAPKQMAPQSPPMEMVQPRMQVPNQPGPPMPPAGGQPMPPMAQQQAARQAMATANGSGLFSNSLNGGAPGQPPGAMESQMAARAQAQPPRQYAPATFPGQGTAPAPQNMRAAAPMPQRQMQPPGGMRRAATNQQPRPAGPVQQF